MSFSRRRFLQQGSMAALFCAGPLQVWSANRNNPGNANSLAHITGKVSSLSRRLFEGAVGSTFQVSAGAGGSAPAWLTLAAVNDLPALAPVNTGAMAVPPPAASGPAVTTEGFMLSFNGGPSTGLGQGTYFFEHSALGQFQLFIVPEGRSPQAYTAVFNQVEAAAVAAAPPPTQLPGRSRPGNAPGAGGIGAGNAGSGSAGSSDAGGGSVTRQPAQQPLEPFFGHSLKSKLPE